MTVHTDLVTAFGTDLLAAGVVTSAAHVYGGRRPGRVTNTALEVWVELNEREEVGTGSQRITRHVYMLHLRAAPRNAGAGGVGNEQLLVAEAAAETIVARYHGELPSTLGGALGGSLVSARAALEDPDEDPEETKVQSLLVRVELEEAA